jgi:hypothetical protein
VDAADMLPGPLTTFKGSNLRFSDWLDVVPSWTRCVSDSFSMATREPTETMFTWARCEHQFDDELIDLFAFLSLRSRT